MDETMYDRFLRIPGADQRALERARIVVIGCGGLGGEVSVGLARKGVGSLTLLDHDVVELSNLARQQFGINDVGRNKALALAANLKGQATGRSFIQAYATSFQHALEQGFDVKGDIMVIGVDNSPTRLAAAHYCLENGVPAIFLAVDDQAAKGYVFVQTSKSGDACFACLYPNASEDRQVHGCAGASIEILKAAAGIALYAVDSLLMPRPRPWNFKTVFLDVHGDGARQVAPRLDCRLCVGHAV